MNIKTTLDDVRNSIVNEVKASSLFARHKFTPLSRLYTIIRALANACFLFIDSTLVELMNAVHPHTATEDDLQEWMTRYGLTWEQATKAQHKVRIGSEVKPLIKISIPQGLIVSTPGDSIQKIQFKVLDQNAYIDASTIEDSEGYYTTEVTVECLVSGEIGNVVEYAISVLDSAPTGINVIYNPDSIPFFSGGERETVASVRERIYNFENTSSSKWTPTWFKSEAENYAFVLRAVFVSSKDLGIPGTIKLILIGTAYNPISQVNLDLVASDFNSEDKNPGGSVHVLTENANIQTLDLAINVYFVDATAIPTQSVLDNIATEYFYGLGVDDPYLESEMRAPFLALNYAVNAVISPSGNVIPASGYILVPGTVTINGLVYGV